MSFTKSLKEKTRSVWEDCYNHPFVQKIGNGTLDREVFKFYISQDYKYLHEYAKVFALGALKATDERMLNNFTLFQKAVVDEINQQRNYLESFGISKPEADATVPSLFNKAYTSFMMAVGYNGGLLELLAAVLPCAWSYYDFGCRLKEDYKDNLENNYYKNWIVGYASDELFETFEWFFPAMDKLCEHKSEVELEKIANIFKSSMEFEYLFWDMAYNKKMSY